MPEKGTPFWAPRICYYREYPPDCARKMVESYSLECWKVATQISKVATQISWCFYILTSVKKKIQKNSNKTLKKIKKTKKEIKNSEVFYEIVDFFVFDICFKPWGHETYILLKSCSERQSPRLLEPQKFAPNTKSCSKVAEHNRERPTRD